MTTGENFGEALASFMRPSTRSAFFPPPKERAFEFFASRASLCRQFSRTRRKHYFPSYNRV